MFLFRVVVLIPLLMFVLALNNAEAQDSAVHGVVPLHKPRSGQWVEKVWGDPDRPGEPFVIRIHSDAGYIILPHTHLVDENIVVVQGVWSLGMGRRFDRAVLEQLDVGAFGFAPKNMAHFAWSKTETTIQVHGIGPFSSKLVDPVYELTEKGTFLLTYLLRPGTPTQSAPLDCFAWKIGTRVRGQSGEGAIIGARCSPENNLTQYWLRKPDGEQFWALSQELKPIGPEPSTTAPNKPLDESGGRVSQVTRCSVATPHRQQSAFLDSKSQPITRRVGQILLNSQIPFRRLH